MNGLSNGSCGLKTQWSIGLVNNQYKYLTAESFGFKINSNGASLKKKQLWTLEVSGEDGTVSLKSHLNKYLAVDQFGNVNCESDDCESESKFTITFTPEGAWALKNEVRGYFLGSSTDKLICAAKVPGKAELWTPHLQARPQVNIRSVGRKRYAHLSDSQEEVQVDANVPWGDDTLFTLEFRDQKYAIHNSCTNGYLTSDGKLSSTFDATNSLFTLEFHNGYLALKDRLGQYLSPTGSRAILRTRSSTVTKDELFVLEDSIPQACFTAFNGRYVSVKQGVDVTANQDEISDDETFQLEFDKNTNRWYIRTMKDKYWTLQSGAGIQANADKRSSNSLFDLSWLEDGSTALIANNGKYVAAKKSGHLFANSEKTTDTEKFFFHLVNRPALVLKGDQGFVGYKSSSGTKLDCNKASYETIRLERNDNGLCSFRGLNGKYWHVDDEGFISVDSDTSEGFFIELREPSKICIKTKNGLYVIAEKNGAFKASCSDSTKATLWEY